MDNEDQIKSAYSGQFIENLRQSYSNGNDIILGYCSMAETAMAYACGDLGLDQSTEIEKHITACKFCTDLVVDTRLAEWDAQKLSGQDLKILPALSNAIHEPATQTSMLSFLRQLPAFISNFCSLLLSPRVMATLATACLAFIIINYGLNDSQIFEKSVMPPKKAQIQNKTVPQTIKPSLGAQDQQKNIHPKSPDTHKKYDAKEHINSFKPLYEDKPDAFKVRKPRRSRLPRTPLERIDISQLTLVGIVVSADGNKALLESASGKGYVVKEGDYIGTHSGKIVGIRKDRIVIEEEMEDGTGGVKIFRTELSLNSKN